MVTIINDQDPKSNLSLFFFFFLIDFGPPLPYFIDIISPAVVCAEKIIESEPPPKTFYFGIAWLDGRLATATIEERDASKVKTSFIGESTNSPEERIIDDINVNETEEGFETEKVSVIKENTDYSWKISSALQTHHTLFGIEYVNISLANDGIVLFYYCFCIFVLLLLLLLFVVFVVVFINSQYYCIY
jgi:hypothetical protein